MPQRFPVKFFVLIFFVFFLISCESKDTKRVYEEIIVSDETPSMPASKEGMLPLKEEQGVDPQALLQEMIKNGEDPHAFMKGAMPKDQIPSGQMTMDSANQQMLLASKGKGTLQWKTPTDWSEKPASGMRLASFSSSSQPEVDVSIVSLSGQAGGLLANVNRWLNQTGAKPFDQPQFEKFLSQQKQLTTQSGLKVQLIDLTDVSKNSPTVILAAMIELDEETVFIKMTGPSSAVAANREAFMQLLNSIHNPS